MKLSKPKTRCKICKMLYWKKHTCQRNPKLIAFRNKVAELEQDRLDAQENGR
jgi:hypothetical protein